MTPGAGRRVLRREHDRRRAHAGHHVHGRLRAGRGHRDGARRRCRQQPGLDIPIHVDGASGGVHRAVHPAGTANGISGCLACKSINTSGHKYGLAPLGVGWVIWRDAAGAAGGADLPRGLSRRRHADVRAELQPARRRDHRAVLQLHPAGPRGLSRRSSRRASTRRSSSPRKSPRWARSTCSTTATAACRRWPTR